LLSSIIGNQLKLCKGKAFAVELREIVNFKVKKPSACLALSNHISP